MSPFGAIARGMLAGAVGTLAMDLLWYVRQRHGGGEPFPEWELSGDTEGYDEAGTPAEVGCRVATNVLGVDMPDRTAGTMNDVVHWITGIGYGAAHGAAAGDLPADLGVRRRNIYKDLSAHLVFGLATAATFWMVRPRSSGHPTKLPLDPG